MPARDDGDLAHGIGAGREHPDDRVPALVVGRASPVLGAQHHLPLGAEHDPFQSVGEVRLLDHVVGAPRGGERSLVDEVGEIGSDHARRRGRDPGEIDVRAERDAARMHAKDRLATRAVGRLDGDAAVEPPGAKKRLVENVRSVRGGDDDDAGRGIESVHLGQDLVQRLLALVVAAAVAGNATRPRAADRVQLVDEYDRRSVRLRLLEQVPHSRGADADDRFDELGRGHRVEGHVRLAGDRAREQCLAGPGRTGEENAVRDPAAEAPVLVGVAQEVDDLAQLVLRLLDAGDVRERHLVARGLRSDAPGSARTSRARSAHSPPDGTARRAAR